MKLKRLLIIPGYHEASGGANTICLNELLAALKLYSDISVDIAGTAVGEDNYSVTLKKDPIEYAKKIVHWPVVSPKASEQCYREIVDALSKDTYDAMLVMHMPYDGVLAAVKAKSKYPSTKLFLYELDPIDNEIHNQRKSLGRYLFFLRELAELRTFKACDAIFHMECNRTKYEDKKYDRYRSKFQYLDFPLIHHNEKGQQSGTPYEGQTIQLIYTGKLMAHFRSPSYLLEVLKEVKKSLEIKVRFFSAGDCEKQISAFAADHPWVEQCGYVDKETLGFAIESSDCLINIGNKISDMLPSKLLTYIETGMPIVHVKNQKNDACIPYLEKYDLALIVDEEDAIEVSAKKVISFLRNSFGQRLSGDWIVKMYCKNTPKYSAECINKLLCLAEDEKGNLETVS